MGEATTGAVRDFQQTVREYYQKSGRLDLPWRQPEADGSLDPYKVLVSEIMLQQTQVGRVIPKYQAFIAAFPAVEDLAGAELGAVLRLWNGLGYNRRAKYLWQAAREITTVYHGRFPDSQEELTKLPGVGKNTAGAIIAYAYNRRVVFIETNIRTVFIHRFFQDEDPVKDAAIERLIEKSLPDEGEYRDWYWALMDYGTYLKQTVGNLSRRSTAYACQSQFVGSFRQVRGQIIRSLQDKPKAEKQLRAEIDDERLPSAIAALIEEGLVRRRHNKLSL